MKRNPINPNKHEQDERPSRSTWVLLGLSGLFLVLTLLLMVLKDPASSWLPVHLHSVLAADYSQDPRGRPIAQVRFSVIRDIFVDLAENEFLSATVNPDERYANVIDELQTPVPTVTAMPGTTVYVPTTRPDGSPTPVLPTDAIATPTPFNSTTPTVTQTGTLPASPTPTHTMVFVYPTATRRPPTQQPTRTQPPAATSTSAPPPTQPPTAAPTATARPTQPPPPTPQPTKPSYPPPYP